MTTTGTIIATRTAAISGDIELDECAIGVAVIGVADIAV